MIHLMELELRKVNLRPYIYAGFAAILCMVGLLYTFTIHQGDRLYKILGCLMQKE